MTATATHPGVVTYPGTGGLGVRGTLIAVPLCEGEVIVLDDGLTLGPATAQTDATGTLQGGGIKVPIISGLLWDLIFEPQDNDLTKVRLGTFNLNTSGVALEDLVATVPFVVDESTFDTVTDLIAELAGFTTASDAVVAPLVPSSAAGATALALDARSPGLVVVPVGSASANVTLLEAEAVRAANFGIPLVPRGAFSIDDGIDLPNKADVRPHDAIITMTGSLKPFFRVNSGISVTIDGGTYVGKGTDYVNTGSVYPACVVRVMSGAGDVSVVGVTATNIAGACVEDHAGRVGKLRVERCKASGVRGTAAFPTNDSSYGSSAGVRVLAPVEGTEIVNCDFSGFSQGVIQGEDAVNFAIRGCHLHDVAQHGIYSQTAAGIMLLFNFIWNTALCGLKNTIEQGNVGTNSDRILAIGNNLRNGGAQAMLFTNPSIDDGAHPLAAAARLRRIVCSLNVIEDYQHGIVFNPGCEDGVATGNVIKFKYVTDYTAWATGVVVAANTVVKSNGRAYRTTAGGTTGATAPTHASGGVSDGGVTWNYFSNNGMYVERCKNISLIGNEVIGGTDQPIEIIDLTGGIVSSNSVKDPCQGNGTTTEYSLHVTGATTELVIAANRFNDTLGNAKHHINIAPTSVQDTISCYDNTGTGCTDEGIKTLGTAMRSWHDNAVIGTLGRVLQPPVMVQTVASTATFTLDADAYTKAKITAQAAALTIANPTGKPLAMQSFVLRIKDNGTARAITYGSQFRAIGVTLPTTTVISKTLYLGFVWNSDDTKWDCIAVAQEA